MNHSDKKLFLAVFFNEPDKIRELVEERNGNTELLFPIPDKYCELWLRFKGTLIISAFELAVMLADTLFDLKENTELKNYVFFNPSEEYRKITGSTAFLKNYTTLTDIDYNRYYNLVTTIGDNEEYLSEKEMNEYFGDGYRQIDLELINSAYKRNETKVRELIATGANPYIDPLDEIEESIILDILARDDSFSFTQYISYRQDGYNEDYTDEWLAEMLERLYETGSSSRLYRIIDEGSVAWKKH